MIRTSPVCGPGIAAPRQDPFKFFHLHRNTDTESELANYTPSRVKKHPNFEFRTQWRDPAQFVEFPCTSCFGSLRIHVHTFFIASTSLRHYKGLVC